MRPIHCAGMHIALYFHGRVPVRGYGGTQRVVAPHAATVYLQSLSGGLTQDDRVSIRISTTGGAVAHVQRGQECLQFLIAAGLGGGAHAGEQEEGEAKD